MDYLYSRIDDKTLLSFSVDFSIVSESYPEDFKYEFDITPSYWDIEELSNIFRTLEEGRIPSNLEAYAENIFRSLEEEDDEIMKKDILRDIEGSPDFLQSALEILLEEGMIYKRSVFGKSGKKYGLNCIEALEEAYSIKRDRSTI